MRSPAISLPLLLLLGVLSAGAGELKVDINRDTKNLDAYTELGFTKWSADTTGGATAGTAAATKSFTSATGENITVSFSQTALSASRGGTGLLTNWYQAGAQGSAKLVADGFTVAPATLATGGEIQMTITGLAAGHHTLLTYHNHWDALSPGTLGPIDIFVNGTLAVDNLQPTIRAATNPTAPVAYVEFDVAGPSDVTTILFSAERNTAGSVTIKDPVINGFEIDTPNSTRTANTPLPPDGDEHVDADGGGVPMSWAAATSGSAVSHDFYFGLSRSGVQNATRTSPEFVRNQTGTSTTMTGLKSDRTYFWRVDEIDSAGNATKGVVWYFRPRHLAFPAAEGYGRFARGGRGGVIVEVTNLDDSGPGSLRDAIEGNYGPRTVIFNVSGLITLLSSLTISQPFITVAGETAPGKGICVRGCSFGMSGGKDEIVRNMRYRPGKISGQTLNGTGMAGSDHCIMDHCSISWGIDEEISTRTSKNITLQRTLISEALNIAGHQNYPAGTEHGYAATIGGEIGSFHHNLLAHNEGRNWSMGGGLDGSGNFAGRLDIFNNVVYNWGSRSTDGGAHEVNFVNNYYRPGAGTTFFKALSAQYDNFPGTQQYYFAGNVMPGYFDETTQTNGRIATNGTGTVPTSYSPWVNAPFFPSYATIHTAREAFNFVLSDVGCNQPALDDHDIRVVRETRDGTYTYTGTGPYGGRAGMPNSETDVGGWEDYPEIHRAADWDSDHDGLPDFWEVAMGYDLQTPDQNLDRDGDGYTALEDYLNWLAAPHAINARDTATTFDLAPLAAGFTAPVFQVGKAAHGTVALLPDGHSARFTPTAGYQGVGTFELTATGGGTVMHQTVGLCFTPALAPALAIEQPAGTPLAKFANVDLGTIEVGSNASLTFTITNSGTAELEGLAFTIDGLNAGDFVVTGKPTAPIAIDASATFSVRFQPSAIGARTAGFHLTSNDPAHSPFDLVLNGQATDTTAPALSAVAIASSGAKPGFAKLGQMVTLTVTANENIKPPRVTIASATATVTGANKNWSASIIVDGSTPEGPAAFTVDFDDLAGNPGATLSATTNASSVTIDRTAPTLTLPADVSVQATMHGGANVSYPPATAADTMSGLAGLQYSRVAGALFGLGTSTVTVTATDNAGNSSSGAFTVTVTPQPLAKWAATGEPVLGSGVAGSGIPAEAEWRTFGTPGIDQGTPGSAGALVFLGSFSSPTGGVQNAVFGFGGAVPLIAKSGDDAPGVPGTKFFSFREPVGQGGTAFAANLKLIPGAITAAADQGIWSNAFPDAAGALRLVAREGSPAPVAGLVYKTLGDLALNDGGNLFWTASLAGQGVKAATDQALFAQASVAAGPKLLLREGQPVSIGLTTPLLKSFVALRDGGSAYGDGLSGGAPGYGAGRADGGAITPVLLTLDDKRNAVATVGPNSPLAVVAITNDPAPGLGGATWKTLGIPAAAPSGAMAFRATVAGSEITRDNAAVLFLQPTGGAPALLARQGEDAPGLSGLKYAAFSDPYLSGAGDVLFFARLGGTGVSAANNEALYWQPQGDTTASLVARIGFGAPGISDALIAKFTGAALLAAADPDGGRGPVFTANLKVGPGGVKATDSAGLWAVDSTGVIRLLARTGSEVQGKMLKTIGAFSYVLGSPMQARTAAGSATVVYRATFTDKTSALIEVAIP